MQKSGFFNSVSGDRKYSAEDWAAYFASFISNGVFAEPSNSLQVMISSGMGIVIKPGIGFINGYRIENTTDLAKTLAVADGIYNRIDRVVIRWSLLNRAMTIEVLQGTPASTPQAPSLTRNAEVYEMALADIVIGAGVTSVLQSNITDRRSNPSLCGWVTGVIDQFDFTNLCTQFEAFFSEYQVMIENEYDYWHDAGEARYQSLDSAMDAFEVQAKREFDEWFATVQYVLDGDVAGHLQNEIDAMESVVNTAVADLQAEMNATIAEVRVTGFSTYTHSKSGTVHTLTLQGGGNNIKFVATANFEKNDSFKINGKTVTAMLPNGKLPGKNFFTTNAVVIGFLSGTTFYLVGGGGGGSGEQYSVTIAPSAWYAQSPNSQNEYWYAADVIPGDFDSTEVDVVACAADAATFLWLSKNAFYELAIKTTGFSIQAKEKPTASIKIFYELKAKGEA